MEQGIISTSSGSGRQRVISSCLTCRRRKVRCDHGHPICGACVRGNHVCTYATDQAALGRPLAGSSSIAPVVGARIAKPVGGAPGSAGRAVPGGASVDPSTKSLRRADVRSRLDRLELLLERAAMANAPAGKTPAPGPAPGGGDAAADAPSTPSSNGVSNSTGFSSDNGGTLLVDESGSHFVSSMHWALLADELQDIRELLSDGPKGGKDADQDDDRNNHLISMLSLGRAPLELELVDLLPDSQELRNAYLDAYFSHVDNMVRITHKGTLSRKFDAFVHDAHPLAFAILYTAVHALSAQSVLDRFGETKDDLLARYGRGVEVSLIRDDYLTSGSLEVLQAFVLWVMCQFNENNVGRPWALLGVAIRIALHQGLHQDPTLFGNGAMDAVTVELRRRLWHQICSLDYRTAEWKGQEPQMPDDAFTTLVPLNVDDEDLVEGAPPFPYGETKFTNTTFQCMRWTGLRAQRRVIRSTYSLERRMHLSSLHGTPPPDAVSELKQIFQQLKVLVHDMRVEHRSKFLCYCHPDEPFQRLTLHVADLMEWRCWVVFWLRMPRAYRELVFPHDIRRQVFSKSISAIEALHGRAPDELTQRARWSIGASPAFQATMHVLSELRNPSFDSPDRYRALQVLQEWRTSRGDADCSGAWTVVRGMIDKVVAEYSAASAAAQPPDPMPMPAPVSEQAYLISSGCADPKMPPSLLSVAPNTAPTSAPLPSSDPQPIMSMQPAPSLQYPSVAVPNLGLYSAAGMAMSDAYATSSNVAVAAATTADASNAQTMEYDFSSMSQQQPLYVDDAVPNFDISNLNNLVGMDVPDQNLGYDWGYWGNPFNVTETSGWGDPTGGAAMP